jgi:hypothetical protein
VLYCLPEAAVDSLAARLDRPAPAKEIVQIGAAIGREFSVERGEGAPFFFPPA